MAETPRLPSPEIRAALANADLAEGLAALERLRGIYAEVTAALDRVYIELKNGRSKKPSVSRG